MIAVVAMIAIGPKDMPVAIRAVTGWVKKARRMAAEFQTHVDEMVREADLSEVRASINEIRNFDIRGEIEKTIDADGSIRSTFASNPLAPTRPAADVGRGDRRQRTGGRAPMIAPAGGTGGGAATPCTPRAPAFVPPNLVPPVHGGGTTGEPEPPAFIPPDVVQQRRARPSA